MEGKPKNHILIGLKVKSCWASCHGYHVLHIILSFSSQLNTKGLTLRLYTSFLCTQQQLLHVESLCFDEWEWNDTFPVQES